MSVEQNAERYAESELPFFTGVLRTPSLGALPFFMGRAPIFHRRTPMGSRGVPETRAAGGHWQFYWLSDAWALGEGAMQMELANAIWKSPMDSRRVLGIYIWCVDSFRCRGVWCIPLLPSSFTHSRPLPFRITVYSAIVNSVMRYVLYVIHV